MKITRTIIETNTLTMGMGAEGLLTHPKSHEPLGAAANRRYNVIKRFYPELNSILYHCVWIVVSQQN